MTAVYVDDVRFRHRGMIMCHMWSEDLDALHAMADAIGMERRWFQAPPKASWSHYDISLTKKRMAIARGAILTDRWGALEHTARLRDDAVLLERIEGRRARAASRTE